MATLGTIGSQPAFRSTDDEPEYKGSRMVFQQAAAPTGWTRNVDSGDCTLRVSNGTSFGLGPGNPFSSSYPATNITFSPWTAADTITINPHVTTVSEMQSHTHQLYVTAVDYKNMNYGPASWFALGPTVKSFLVYSNPAAPNTPVTFTVGNVGSPAPAGHTHTITGNFTQTFPANFNFNIKYVMAIVATRNIF
jgi:hypothetical protein